MAQKVELEFTGSGNLFEDLRRLKDGVGALGTVHQKVQTEIHEGLKQSTADVEEFNSAITVSAKVVADVGKSAASGIPTITKGLDTAAQSADKLAGGLEVVREEVEATGAQTKAAAAEQDKVTGKVKLTADQYNAITAKLKAAGVGQNQLLKKVAQTALEQQEVNAAAGGYTAEVEQTEDAVVSLTAQLRAAKREAAEIAAEFGVDSEQAIAAQRRVGALANEVDDLNKRFQAFDPSRPIEAVNQLTFSLISGLSAVQGVFGAIAGDNQQLQQTLFIIQGLLFAGQGLQGFISGFGQSLKTIRAFFTANTAAAVANTEANVANAAATTASGTAAAAASGGFTTLTASVRAFTVALVTNPIFLAVAAFTILAGIIATSGDEADEATNKFDRLFESLQQFRDIDDAAADLKKSLDDLDIDRRKLNIADTDFKGQAALARESAQVELENLRAKQQVRRDNIASLQAQLFSEQSIGELSVEELKERNAQIMALEKEANDLRGQEVLVRARLLNELAQVDKAALAEAKATAQERKALQEDVVEAERDLARRLREESRRNAGENDPFLRVELERKANLEELAELERGFKRKLALIKLQAQLGRAAFNELTEQEKEARADLIIAQQGIELPAKQQEQINNLKLLVEAQYLRDLSNVQLEAAKERASIIKDANQRETAEFKVALDERVRALRKAGVDELAIIEFQANEEERFRLEQAQKAIDLDAEIQEALINARKKGAETEKEFERQKQLDILNIKIAAAEASLALNVEDGTKERALLRANLQATISELTKARTDLQNTPLDINLLDLLGVAESDQARVKAALQNLTSSFVAALSAINQARVAELEQARSINDQIIDEAQRRREDLQQQLLAEQNDQEAGRANNVDGVRKAIDEQRRIEEAALANRKKLQAEQAKLARQQALIDSLSQASSIITAGATLFKAEAFKGVAGVITSIATIGAMVASFLALRAKIRAATAQAFYRGTARVRRAPNEAPGIDTVHAMLTEDEAVVPRGPARKHNRLVEGLVKDDFSGLRPEDLQPVLRQMNLRLDDSALRKVMLAMPSFTSNKTVATMSTAALERQGGDLLEEIRGFRRQVRKGSIEYGNGVRVLRIGSTTITVRQ